MQIFSGVVRQMQSRDADAFGLAFVLDLPASRSVASGSSSYMEIW